MKLKERISLGLGKAVIYSASGVERLIHGAAINPISPALGRDPYPHHSGLREKHPIHYSIGAQAWWVTSFAAVQEVLRDKRFGADVRKYPKRLKRIHSSMDEERREAFDNPSMLDRDPPEHTRLRKLGSQGFMHKFVQSLEPNIRRIVDECLAPTSNESGFDVMETLAQPLPAYVIAEMMGLPNADYEQFRQWSEDIIAGSSTNDADLLIKSDAADRALRAYFRDIIRARRGNPGDDLIGQLIRAEEAGDKLTEMELYSTCLLLLIAGHETTTRLIGNGLHLLLEHPEQFAWLRTNPDAIPAAIEEMLRFEPPVQATRRFVTEDLEFHGHRMTFGQQVLVSIAGANRDPAVNPAPDEFDIRRESGKQVSFGYGIHLCIGASLARLEARVAFEELFRRYPSIEAVAAEPHWGTNPFFRGLESLPVRVAAR